MKFCYGLTTESTSQVPLFVMGAAKHLRNLQCIVQSISGTYVQHV